MRRMALAILAGTALLTGCDTWWGESAAPPLKGKRISVLSHERAVEPDSALVGRDIRLPRPEAVADWPEAGGNAAHAMHHLDLGEMPQRQWSTSVGKGSTGRTRLLAQPVVAAGKVFTLDVRANVTAIDAGNGAVAWRADVTPEDEQAMGGGLAFEDGKLFVTTGFAQIVALKAATGEVLWRQSVSAPLRGAPTARNGRIYAITVDNQTHAFSAQDGRPLWTHAGISEVASLLGGSSPAVEGDVVVVPYSSGELFALRADNGTQIWSDSLNAVRRTDAVATLTDIRGLPVIDHGRVFAISNSDMLAAIEMRSGRRLWEREIGGIQTPWLAGDYLYVVSNAPELVALEARTGRVAWVTPLQRFKDEEDKKGRLVWSGPVLAGDRLIVVSSHGLAVSISPYSGELLGQEEMPDGVTIPPVIADRTAYFLTKDADLLAYR